MTPERRAFLVNVIATNATAHGKVWTGPAGEALLQAADAIREMSAHIAELEATILNERGEGAPPVPGFVWVVTNSMAGLWRKQTDHNDILVQRTTARGWYWTDYSVGFTPKNVYPTARAAMLAAHAAQR